MKLKVFFAATLLCLTHTSLAETVLRYSDHEPLSNMRTKIINDVFFKAIEQESQGRIRVDAHWSGELAVSYDALKTIGEGQKADIGIVVPEYTAEQLPLYQIFKSFPLGPDNGEKQVRFFHNVFATIPQFAAELAANNLVNLQFFLGYPAAFFSTDPSLKYDDLKNTTWRTASFWHQSYLENAGAKVIKMPWNEQITEALRDGKLDGLLVNLDSGDDIKAWQGAKEVGVSQRLWLGHVYLLVMNKARWESLALQDKQAIQRAAARTEKILGSTLDASLNEMVSNMNAHGAHAHFLTTTELESWQNISHYQSIQADWIAVQTAKGVQNTEHILKAVEAQLQAIE
ncbi:TRAP transporter substrate-binding protein DctP [Kluyvera genomosp. 1]|uniref:TRAP transporter substrate-binding protein DctP n=1 Tax=Kluyvera genomosp. 1 TaxID=2774053 RepID=UPI0006921052|nr:TRAP transporter substrate-binding protein DctP [Kluyvera genomosp. 1]